MRTGFAPAQLIFRCWPAPPHVSSPRRRLPPANTPCRHTIDRRAGRATLPRRWDLCGSRPDRLLGEMRHDPDRNDPGRACAALSRGCAGAVVSPRHRAAASSALPAAQASVAHTGQAHPAGPAGRRAGHLCHSASIASGPGAHACAAAGRNPAHAGRGVGPVVLAGALPDTGPQQRLQSQACLRQPPPRAPPARTRPARGLLPADGRTGSQGVPAVPGGGPHRGHGRGRHRAHPCRRRRQHAVLARLARNCAAAVGSDTAHRHAGTGFAGRPDLASRTSADDGRECLVRPHRRGADRRAEARHPVLLAGAGRGLARSGSYHRRRQRYGLSHLSPAADRRASWHADSQRSARRGKRSA